MILDGACSAYNAGMSRTFGLLALIAVSTVGYGQPARLWTRTTGLTMAGNTAPNFIACDSANNTIVAKTKSPRNGDRYNGYAEITKLTSAGSVAWTRNLFGNGSGYGDIIACRTDNAGNVVIVYGDFLSPVFPSYTLSKIAAATGATLWERKNVPLNFPFNGDLAIDGANNIFIGGNNMGPDFRFGLAKINGATGATLYSTTLTRAAAGVSDLFDDLAVDSANNVVMVGTSRTSNFCTNPAPAAIRMTKVNGATGAGLWTTSHTALANDQNFSAMVDIDSTNNPWVGASVGRAAGMVWAMTKRNSATGASMAASIVSPAGVTLSQMTDLTVDGLNGVSAAGDYFGITSGVYVYWLNSLGGGPWSRQLADRQVSNSSGAGTHRKQLVRTPGNSITAAYTRDTTGAGRPTSAVVVTKMNAGTGATLWEKIYNAAAAAETEARSVGVTSTGDIVVGSSVETGPVGIPTVQSHTTRLLLATGNPVFSVMPGNVVAPTPDFGRGIVVDTGGNSYTVGSSVGRIVVEKVDTAGALVWQVVYDGAPDISSPPDFGGQSIARDGVGNIIAVGQNRGNLAVLKINGTTGAVMWASRLAANVPVSKFALDGAGNIYLPLSYLGLVCKVNGANGLVLWTTSVNGSGTSDSVDFVAVSNAGIPFACGQTANFGACSAGPDSKIMVARMNPTNGATTWLSEVARPIIGQNEPSGVAVDTTGNVLIAGNSRGVAIEEVVTARFNGISGAALWTVRQNLAGRPSSSTDMMLDSSNNLISTGFVYNSATNDYDTFTFKSFNATGARAWANTLAAPAGNQAASDLARDSLNNIFVVGLVDNNGVMQQFAQKLSGASGAQMWAVLCPGAAFDGLTGAACGVDPANSLRLLGSTGAGSAGLSQETLVKFGP